jgi:cell wall-associated NlpC family hydrolase
MGDFAAQQLQFVNLVMRSLGTPYGHQGRTPGRALDCAGLFICAAKGAGLLPADYDFVDYPPDPSPRNYEKFFRDFDVYLDRVSLNDLRPGDTALTGFRTLAKHVCVAVGEDVSGALLMVHALPEYGVVLQSLDAHQLKLVTRAYRFRGGG